MARENKKWWYIFKGLYAVFSVVLSFFHSILHNLLGLTWINYESGFPNIMGWIFLIVWIIATFLVFVPDIIKNEIRERKEKDFIMANKTLAILVGTHSDDVLNITTFLDTNQEFKVFKKIIENENGDKSLEELLFNSKVQLKKIAEQMEQQILKFFDKSLPHKIDTNTNFSYRINNGDWRRIAIKGRSFDPQKFYSKETDGLTRNEGLIFHITKEEAIDTNQYNRMNQESKTGSVLYYGFKIISDDHTDKKTNEKKVYIEAIFSVFTDFETLTKSKEKYQEIIKTNLELIIFKHYKDKIKNELFKLYLYELYNQEVEKHKRIKQKLRKDILGITYNGIVIQGYSHERILRGAYSPNQYRNSSKLKRTPQIIIKSKKE